MIAQCYNTSRATTSPEKLRHVQITAGSTMRFSCGITFRARAPALQAGLAGARTAARDSFAERLHALFRVGLRHGVENGPGFELDRLCQIGKSQIGLTP